MPYSFDPDTVPIIKGHCTSLNGELEFGGPTRIELEPEISALEDNRVVDISSFLTENYRQRLAALSLAAAAAASKGILPTIGDAGPSTNPFPKKAPL